MIQKRYASLWFRYLTTDWLTLRRPELQGTPFVFAVAKHGRKVITAINPDARSQGIATGMPVADAKAMVHNLQVFDDKPQLEARLLKALGEWCIRYTPIVALDLPNGLFLDISGCVHLWGGEQSYLQEILTRLRSKGYTVQGAIADTVGTAWAVSRYGRITPIVESGQQAETLLPLPPAALRLETAVLQRMHKLGLYQVSNFIRMPRSVLRRRFGEGLLLRLSQALGQEKEIIYPLQITPPYQERLPCLEPIRTAVGIEIAIKNLLERLCIRLKGEGKGLRKAILKCYRVDGRIIQTEIGTNRPSHHAVHLFKLFELKISSIEPALGIELFVMEAPKVEDTPVPQEVLWTQNKGLEDTEIAELLDRIAIRIGTPIHRYLPDEHYWPERSLKNAVALQEKSSSEWQTHKPRPIQLLTKPERIEVTAPIPDYPPLLFRYKGETHHIKKADGPERIEREWWLDTGEHRDYYQVEDENGQRYWLFRSGHYDEQNLWFLHGFFA